MAKLRKFFSRIRLVYRRSSTLTKCVVLAAILLSTVTVITLGIVRHETQVQTEALRQEAAVLEQENQKLRDSISILGTVESVKQIARDVLGLVDPDTVVFETDQTASQ